MRIEELNWMDVEKYLKKEDRIILVLGACEQHGFLSLMTDTKIPVAIADAVSKKTGVVVAPSLNFGISPSFAKFPGTITFRVSTYLDAIEDMVRSLYRVGFKRFMLLNGHGGNIAVKGKLHEMLNEIPDLHFVFYSWWMEPAVEEVMKKHVVPGFHANWMEAFRFTRVAELPEGTKEPPKPSEMLNADRMRKVYKDGVYGGSYIPDDKILDEVFTAAVDEVCKLIQFS
jgi:creatinine amidohydrolase